jgi:protein-S-isoprenylcysteine O-methyltransferase Ste14
MEQPRSTLVRPPASATSGLCSLIGLAGFIGCMAYFPSSGLSNVHRAIIAIAATALPMLIYDVLVTKVHRRPSTGLDWSGKAQPSAPDPLRCTIKLLGFAATLALIGFAYWVFPEYRKPMYQPFWQILRQWLPFILGAAIPYFVLIDGRMVEPRDGYWHAGMAVIGRFDRVDPKILGQYALGWLVKGYFLPLMLVFLVENMDDVMRQDLVQKGDQSFLALYRFGWTYAFAVDVIFATIGYIMTLRLFDSHIRSTEPTTLGWLVALICYPPFFPTMYDNYVPYDPGIGWGPWLSSQPVLQVAWGTTILALVFIYAWASMIFGYRFSNLTHRGILTSGAYRLTKHPAYVSKNLSWWLVSIPFISHVGAGDALRHCAMLLCINAIYFLRARTEERHLSADPTYVAYGLWMNEHSLFSGLGRLVPSLRYVPPAKSQAGAAMP